MSLLYISLPCMDNNSLAKQARGIGWNTSKFIRACLCGGWHRIARASRGSNFTSSLQIIRQQGTSNGVCRSPLPRQTIDPIRGPLLNQYFDTNDRTVCIAWGAPALQGGVSPTTLGKSRVMVVNHNKLLPILPPSSCFDKLGIINKQ